jgi:hypothetical protein
MCDATPVWSVAGAVLRRAASRALQMRVDGRIARRVAEARTADDPSRRRMCEAAREWSSERGAA